METRIKAPGELMRWYFSRPTSDGGSPFEDAVLRHFRDMNLENPNQGLHDIGFSQHGLEYLFFTMSVLPAYDGCIAAKLPNGRWSAAVAREVKWFQANRRIVFKLHWSHRGNAGGWDFKLERLKRVDPALICSVEMTRALVHHYRDRPDNGRSLAEDRQDPMIEPITHNNPALVY